MDGQVKLLLAFDIRADRESAYRRFILGDFLPQAQALGLTPTDAWHTAYGNYPLRLLGFVAQDLAKARAVRASEQWKALIEKLAGYTRNLTQRLVWLKGGFQW